jgi:hypothetical protein
MKVVAVLAEYAVAGLIIRQLEWISASLAAA